MNEVHEHKFAAERSFDLSTRTVVSKGDCSCGLNRLTESERLRKMSLSRRLKEAKEAQA